MSAAVLERMIAEARQDALQWMNPDLGRWLPDVIPNFTLLIPGLKSAA
jgi:hypothetical protein